MTKNTGYGLNQKLEVKFILFIGLLALAVFVSGCSAGGPRPKTVKYRQLDEGAQVGKYQMGLPYLDPDFRLAPNDVLGLTFFTSATPVSVYNLQIGDTLLVEFHQQEFLNRNLVVPPDGYISMPYLKPVKVAGRSADQVSRKLTDLYKEKSIFNDVKITVSLIAFNSRLKELQNANFNSLAGQTKDVIISHDGYVTLPLVRDRIMAAGLDMEGLLSRVRKAYRSALPGADVNLELRGVGSNYIYVLGEVKGPGMVEIGGPMGVAQAVAAAGGFTPGADLKSVVVLRSGDDRRPVGRLVDARRILSEGDASGDVLVRRFDVVYVPPSTIQQLNEAVLLYIRNMMPIETHGSLGFNYMWGDTTESTFKPF